MSADLPVTAFTAIVAANDHVIDNAVEAGAIVLILNNTFAGAKDFTIVAGVNPPSARAGLGDLVITMAQDDVRFIVIDPSRHVNAAGEVRITVEAATTGFIGALKMPRALV